MDKICKTCGISKAEECFYICGKYKGNLYRRSICIKCANKESLAYNREYNNKNKKYVNERKRKYMSKLLENDLVRAEINEGQRKRYHRYTVKRLLRNASLRALKNNLEFSISEKDIKIPKICPLLNMQLVSGTKGNYYTSPSLDRIDNTKGYTPDNIWVISSLANTMKNSATLEQLEIFSTNVLKLLSFKDIVRTVKNENSQN